MEFLAMTSCIDGQYKVLQLFVKLWIFRCIHNNLPAYRKHERIITYVKIIKLLELQHLLEALVFSPNLEARKRLMIGTATSVPPPPPMTE